MSWYVTCKPHEEHEEERNVSGLRVLITDGCKEKEVSRVAFTRRHSKNRSKTFKQALQDEIAKAEEAVNTINEYDLKKQEIIRSHRGARGELA